MVPLRSLTILTTSALLTLGAAAQADVVRAPPTDCPEGHKPTSNHSGSYCKPPPPTACPPEHLPKVYRSLAYCEPPPAKPCPPGSRHASKSPTDTYCLAERECALQVDCDDGTCVDTSYCIRWDYPGGRRRLPIVAGPCTGDQTCPSEQECVKSKRCDSANKRVASSPSAAVPVEPSAVGATASPASGASTSGGKPASPPAPAPQATGCAGCSMNASGGWAGAAAVAAALGALTLGRRGRRRSAFRRRI